MTAVYVCECDHLPPAHHGSTYACRTAACRCVRYTPDFHRPVDPFQAADADPAASAPYPLERAPDALSTSARLAKAEQERDKALDALIRTRADREEAWQVAETRERERDLARAEVATARAELEQLRAFNAWIVAEHIHCPNPEGAPT